MRIVLLHTTLIFLFNLAWGQKVNYLAIRDSVLINTCGGLDSSTLYISLQHLKSLDPSMLKKNIHVYYEDLAVRYWLLSGGTHPEYLNLSIEANLKALLHKPKSTKALFNLSFAYFIKSDCENGKYYMTLYRDYTPKKYYAHELEKMAMSNCD